LNARTWKAGKVSARALSPTGEFVERWTTDEFRSYVGDVQAAVHHQLEACVGEQARDAEDAFFWVTHYEQASGTWRDRARSPPHASASRQQRSGPSCRSAPRRACGPAPWRSAKADPCGRRPGAGRSPPVPLGRADVDLLLLAHLGHNTSSRMAPRSHRITPGTLKVSSSAGSGDARPGQLAQELVASAPWYLPVVRRASAGWPRLTHRRRSGRAEPLVVA
jgi:hypothetical protein